MSRLSQYIRNSGVMVAQSVVQRMAGVVSTMVLARMLGVADLGAFSAVINTGSSAYGLVRLGIDAAINVYVAGEHCDDSARKNKGQMLGAGFVLLFVAALAGTATCILFSDLLAIAVYGKKELGSLLLFAGALVFVQCISQYCFATLAGLNRFGGYARIATFSALISVLAVTIGCVVAASLGAIVATLCVQMLSLALLGRITTRTLLEERITVEWTALAMWAIRLLKLGFPCYVAGLLAIPTTYYLQGMVSRHAGIDALGYLRVIASISSLVAFLPASISLVMISKLTQSRSNGERLFASDTLRNLKLIWLFVLCASVSMASVLPWLLPLLYGADYSSALSAGQIAVFSTGFAAVLSVLTNACFASKQITVLFRYSVLQVSAFSICGIALIPVFGLLGYVVAELCSYLIVSIFAGINGYKWLKGHGQTIEWLHRLALLNLAFIVIMPFQHLLGLSAAASGIVWMGSLCAAFMWSYRYVLDQEDVVAIKQLLGWFLGRVNRAWDEEEGNWG